MPWGLTAYVDNVYIAEERGVHDNRALRGLRDYYIYAGHTNILLCGAVMTAVLDDYGRIMQETRCFVPITHLLNALALISAAISIGLWLALMHELNVVVIMGANSMRRWTSHAVRLRNTHYDVRTLLRIPFLFTGCSLIWLVVAVLYARLYRNVDCDLIIPFHPELSMKLQLGVTVYAAGAVFYTACAYATFLRIGRENSGVIEPAQI